MRRIEWLVGLGVLLGGAAGAAGMGACTADLGSCDKYAHVGCPGYTGTGASTTTSTITKTNCPTDPTKVTSCMDLDGCGVFVSKDAPAGGDGSLTNPFQTLDAAAAATPGKVFICGGGTITDADKASFSADATIYGAYVDCTKCAWNAPMANATVQGPVEKAALEITGGTVTIEGLNVTAPDAMNPSGSSIAVILSGGSLSVSTGTFTAGIGKDGSPGSSLGADSALDGLAGDPGATACSAGATHPGPMGQVKKCPNNDTSTGGNGGDGGDSMGANPGGNGTAGSASPLPMSPDGAAGAGEGAMMCTNGHDGVSGASGTAGARATGYGALSSTGYQPTDGKPGTDGNPGQGGGGGGGAKGAKSVKCAGSSSMIDIAGASGGAGGTGGCGGKQGGGGGGGGSSIAFLVLDAQLSLSADTTIMTSQAGNGGAGGDGQPGGNKGPLGAFASGTPADDSCQGGNGGKGGNGGPGGGGLGGHSLGIAYQGSTAPANVMGTFKPGMAGAGGKGGSGNNTTNMGKGDPGQAGKCFDFTAMKTCG